MTIYPFTARTRLPLILGAAALGAGLWIASAATGQAAHQMHIQQSQQRMGQHDMTNQQPVVTVSGNADVAVTPDRAVINIGVAMQDDTALKAQSRVNTTIADVTKAVRELGVEGLSVQTSSINLNPVYGNMRNDRGERQITGYRAHISLSLTIDEIDRAGEVIDAAMKAGANEMNGLRFTLQDDSEPKREALAAAVREAQQKAETIAAALSMGLGQLVEVQEAGTVRPIQPRIGRAMEMQQMSASMAPTPVETGDVQVSASVQLTYRLQ